MKILVLEHPRMASEKRFNDIANTPLWSCLMGGYAASALEREGMDTLFLDRAVPGAAFDETEEKVLSLDPDLLCVNAVYFWEHTPVLFDFLSNLKTKGFSGHINLFGFFPSLIYRQILKECPYIDSIAVGEFEQTLVELARGIEKKKRLENIQGLALASCLLDRDSRMRPPEKNPDIFAFPKRSSLEGTLSVLASRGCYNHCSFCPVPSFYNQGSLWRGRSPENIAREIQDLVDQGIKSFYFCDPNFIGPGAGGRKRIMDLMDRIRPMNIRFGMETRPQDLDEPLMKKLIRSGFQSLLMGIESGSSHVLSRIDKSSGPDRAARAIELCRAWGVEPEIGFLMFVPEGRIEDLGINMDFLEENRLLDRLDRTANLLSHTLIVLAGTSGYGRYQEEGKLQKNGLFGFEGRVAFSDPRVAWVEDLLTFACHRLLKEMSRMESPVFWEKPDLEISRKANDFLVDLGKRLIRDGRKNILNKEEQVTKKQEIASCIDTLLCSGETRG
ncbi:B12-binding domain-containing radical SAM protein [Desulfospira joergensenii]|uniref:B12-binding domain-containing radical SAM protein n=1 Tax=Desulfospira joergensenii TaxID=53329 RepID=UPI0003B3538E|nr:radical SAM protein [Desulfospira joergensenii]